MTVHGNQPSDERTKSASGIETVWKEFVAFIEGHLSGGIHSPNKNQGSLLPGYTISFALPTWAINNDC